MASVGIESAKEARGVAQPAATRHPEPRRAPDAVASRGSFGGACPRCPVGDARGHQGGPPVLLAVGHRCDDRWAYRYNGLGPRNCSLPMFTLSFLLVSRILH